MRIVTLSEQVSVSGQLKVAELASLRTRSIQVLICNRPDGEAADQADFATLAKAASQQGIEAVHLPFVGANPSEDIVHRFKDYLVSGKKIHAYCRTGNRSTLLWEKAVDTSADHEEARE